MLYMKGDKTKRKEITDPLMRFYDGLSDSNLQMLTTIFFASPLLALMVLYILDLSFVTKFVMFVLLLSILSLIYALYILVWLMKKDTGTEEMQTIADSITEGSEGYFRAQYGTIFKLSFVFALLIVVLYWTKSPEENQHIAKIINLRVNAILAGLSFMFGALCSAFSGYAGMWVSVRANLR